MKRYFFLILFLLANYITFCQVYVEGYYRKNGTYVQPHYRSSPDNSPYNNYTYPGNINPYTGKVATGNPETYLKRYKNRNTKNYDILTESEFNNSLIYNKRSNTSRNIKTFRKREKNGIGMFLISVPVVLGTIFILTLKK